MKHPEPKALIMDIETSLDVLAAYGIREQRHNPDNILQDWFVICMCWKWLGGSKIYSTSLLDDLKRYKKDPLDDYAVIKRMHEVISEAEIIIGHNIANFDWRKFMARVIYHKLPPIDRPLMVDTLKEARKIAAFTSNKMSYLAKYLKIENKLHHAGDMWIRILRGDKKAVEEAVIYCRGDIKTTEEMYLRLRPYMITHPNAGLWRADGIDCCKKCGSENIIGNGSRVTLTGKFKRYQCTDCGSYMQGKRAIKRTGLK